VLLVRILATLSERRFIGLTVPGSPLHLCGQPLHTILQRGTSADRQLQIYHETHDLKAVVDDLITLTMENVPETTEIGTPRPTTTASTISK